jgi:hypothetical protein
MQPTAPTIGTATAGEASASVAFTASSYIGKGTISYTATSSPGGFTGTASSSPITVSGLTNGTAYTFTVVGTTNYGVASVASSASNSVTPAVADQGAMFAIATTTVGSAGAASITFSSIPATYKHLQVRGIFNMTSAGVLKMQYNSDTGANYKSHWLYTDGSSVQSGTSSVSPNAINAGYVGASGYFGQTVVDILNYATTSQNRVMRSLDGNDRNGAGDIELSSGMWINTTDAISSITFTPQSGTFNQYTTLALYGIKGA